MALKLGLLVLAALILWMALFRPRRRGPRTDSDPAPKTPPRAEILEPCPRCGVFRLPGGACDCDRRPTSGE
jgi:hypothetical protein